AQTKDKSAVRPEQMIKLINGLKKNFDYIILDCPAGIEQGFRNAIAAADRALVVTTPEVSAIRDADRIIGLLEEKGIRRNHLIVNRLRPELVKRGDMMSAQDIIDLLGVPLIGMIPDDEAVIVATNQGQSLIEGETLPGQAYRNIVRRIAGEDVPYLDLNRHGGFLSRLFGKGK
ncbi:MAG: septum site-determining protein MinD, partial [Lachnospiraceae bacterium]